MSPTISNEAYEAWAVAELTGQATMLDENVPTLIDVSPENPDDHVGYLAIVIEAWCARRVPCPVMPETDRIAAYLMSAEAVAARADSPYLEARSQVGARLLGIPLERVPSKYAPPASITSPADVYNLYGLAWENSQGYAGIDRADLVTKLRPLLDASPDGNEDETSLVAQAWVILGGSPSSLQGMASALQTRVDPTSQLVHSYRMIQGTVATTFEVARLVAQDFTSIASKETPETLANALSSGGAVSAASLGGRLQAACVLETLGALDGTTRQSLARAGQAALGTMTITPDGAWLAEEIADGLMCLHAEVPALTFSPAAASVDDGGLGVLTLMDVAYFAGQFDKVSGYYEPWVRQVLAGIQGYSGSMEFVVRLLPIVNSQANANSAGFRGQLENVINAHTGCPGFPTLLEASTTDGEGCSLKDTRMLVYAGGTYDESRKGWVL